MAYNRPMARQNEKRGFSRRRLLQATAAAGGALVSGCVQTRGPHGGHFEKMWGRAGSSPGRLFRPRAIAIDKSDLLYIVDMTPQIQVFTGEGESVRSWQPPK